MKRIKRIFTDFQHDVDSNMLIQYEVKSVDVIFLACLNYI